MLSYATWKARFASDPNVLGKPLTLDGAVFRVVGVAPEDFRFPATAAAWVPLIFSQDRLTQRGNNMLLSLFARLKIGVSP